MIGVQFVSYFFHFCSIVVPFLFHVFSFCFDMLSICFTSLLYIFRFFPTGELFKVGAAPQKNLHVFYGQYKSLLK